MTHRSVSSGDLVLVFVDVWWLIWGSLALFSTQVAEVATPSHKILEKLNHVDSSPAWVACGIPEVIQAALPIPDSTTTQTVTSSTTTRTLTTYTTTSQTTETAAPWLLGLLELLDSHPPQLPSSPAGERHHRSSDHNDYNDHNDHNGCGHCGGLVTIELAVANHYDHRRLVALRVDADPRFERKLDGWQLCFQQMLTKTQCVDKMKRSAKVSHTHNTSTILVRICTVCYIEVATLGTELRTSGEPLGKLRGFTAAESLIFREGDHCTSVSHLSGDEF